MTAPREFMHGDVRIVETDDRITAYAGEQPLAKVTRSGRNSDWIGWHLSRVLDTRVAAMAALLRSVDEPALVPPGQPLTGRERIVLAHMAAGTTTHTIAALFGVTPRTIDAEVQSVKYKLGAKDKAHAVARGHEAGLLPMPVVQA